MALKLGKKQNKIKRVVKKTAQPSSAPVHQHRAESSDFNLPSGRYFEGVGRRKVAVARVRLYESEGDSLVNNQLVTEYFSAIQGINKLYTKPFVVTNTVGKFAITAQISGSGISAQLDALIHGISRALVEHDPENRALLKQASLLSRDPRMKETRKPGRGGKARRKRQSPKR